MRIGYGRVSTRDQNPDAQHDALKAASCDEVFIDKASGKLARRPELERALLSANRSGDQLVITKLDRLGRSLEHLIELSKQLQDRGVDLVVLDQGIDTSTAVGRLFFQIIGAIAEFEHALMSERTMDGLAAARARGRTGGQKPKLGARQVKLARRDVRRARRGRQPRLHGRADRRRVRRQPPDDLPPPRQHNGLKDVRRKRSELVVLAVGVAQRPQVAWLGLREEVAAAEVDVLVDERAETNEQLLSDRPACRLELRDGFVHVHGVPEHGGVEREAERAELVLHPRAVVLAQLPRLTVAYPRGERVPGLVQVQLTADHPPVALIVQHLQQVHGLEDPAVVRERLTQPGRRPSRDIIRIRS